MHISKYYIKKILIKVNQPIKELSMPDAMTLWEGEFGMKLAHTGYDPNTGDPWEANSFLSLGEDGPVFSDWAPYPEGLGSNKKQESNLENCAVDLYGGLKILGITDLIAPEEVSVQNNNKVLSSELSAGVLYDTFGSS